MTSKWKEKGFLGVYHINESIKGPIEYVKVSFKQHVNPNQRGYIKEGYWQQTACINTFTMISLDFDISTENKTY
jgi:hypothetical protein